MATEDLNRLQKRVLLVPKLFLDTAYLVAIHDPTDPLRKAGVELRTRLRAVKGLRFVRDLFVSDLVLVEAMQTLFKRRGYAEASEATRWMTNNLTILRTSLNDIMTAFEQVSSRYGRGKQRPLGVVDATSIWHMRRQRIGLIVSPDGGFDPVVGVTRVWTDRVEPLAALS